MTEKESETIVENINNPNSERKIELSVIIASFNSSRTVHKALAALTNQQTKYEFEIIVVDSSNDSTPEIVARDFPQVRLFRLDRQTYPGTARNIGIEKARGTFVAFTDSDCLPEPDWVERIVNKFTEVQSEAVGGSLINGYPKSLTAWVSHLIEFNEWTETTPEGFVVNIPSANLAYKRDAFSRFNEYFPDYLGSEDTILNWKMQKKGARIYFDPRISVVHLNRVALKKLLPHQYNLGIWSAKARRNVDLPGSFLVNQRLLVFALPFMRWARAALWLLKKDLPKFFIFILITPIYIATAFAWSMGFVSNREMKLPSQSKLIHKKTGVKT